MKMFSRAGLTIMTIVASVAIYSSGAFAMEMSNHEHPDHRSEGNQCGCNKNSHHHEFAKMLKKELKLSGKQTGEISDIMKEEHTKSKPLFEAIHKERKELMLLSVAETTDEAAIRAQAAKLADVVAVLALDHARVHKRIAGVMTPEQSAKFAELSKKFAEHDPGFGEHFKGKDARRGHKECEKHSDK